MLHAAFQQCVCGVAPKQLDGQGMKASQHVSSHEGLFGWLNLGLHAVRLEQLAAEAAQKTPVHHAGGGDIGQQMSASLAHRGLFKPGISHGTCNTFEDI